MPLPQDEIDILDPECFDQHILDIVINKWTGLIFYTLTSGPKRYNQLRRLIATISQTMLTSTLRKLERNGLVHREIFPVIPPKVEYSLTPLGETLIPIFKQIYQWTGAHMVEIESAQLAYDEQKSAK